MTGCRRVDAGPGFPQLQTGHSRFCARRDPAGFPYFRRGPGLALLFLFPLFAGRLRASNGRFWRRHADGTP